MPKKVKRGPGQPTKYKPKYCQKLIDFYDKEPYEDKELPHYDKDGNLKWTDYKRMANKLPTIRDFAKEIGVQIPTVYNWLKKDHASFQKEFFNTFTQTKDIIKWFIIQNGLQGNYNPLFSIFVAKNITDMTDNGGSDEDREKYIPPPIQIIMPYGSNSNKTKPIASKSLSK